MAVVPPHVPKGPVRGDAEGLAIEPGCMFRVGLVWVGHLLPTVCDVLLTCATLCRGGGVWRVHA